MKKTLLIIYFLVLCSFSCFTLDIKDPDMKICSVTEDIDVYLTFKIDRKYACNYTTIKNGKMVLVIDTGYENEAKLVLNDRFNKDLVMKAGALRRRTGKIRMNKNLNNYKLKWKSPDRLISYQVDESAQKHFEALEELVNIENQQKIKIKPTYIFTIQSNHYKQLLARVKYDETSLIKNNTF